MRDHISALTDHRYALEVLDQLSCGAQRVGELCSALHLSRRAVTGALRVLVVNGLAQGDHAGSWDGTRTVPPNGNYRQTDGGRSLADWLSSFTVWESLQGP